MSDPLLLLRRGIFDSQQDFVDAICQLVRTAKFRYRNEMELHRGLGYLLSGASLQVSPEVPLTPESRIDFVVTAPDGRGGMRPNVGIEVKVKGSTPKVRDQLVRYAGTGLLSHLVLITSRAKHRSLDGLMLPGDWDRDDDPFPALVPVVVARLPWL